MSYSETVERASEYGELRATLEAAVQRESQYYEHRQKDVPAWYTDAITLLHGAEAEKARDRVQPKTMLAALQYALGSLRILKKEETVSGLHLGMDDVSQVISLVTTGRIPDELGTVVETGTGETFLHGPLREEPSDWLRVNKNDEANGHARYELFSVSQSRLYSFFFHVTKYGDSGAYLDITDTSTPGGEYSGGIQLRNEIAINMWLDLSKHQSVDHDTREWMGEAPIHYYQSLQKSGVGDDLPS